MIIMIYKFLSDKISQEHVKKTDRCNCKINQKFFNIISEWYNLKNLIHEYALESNFWEKHVICGKIFDIKFINY